MIIRAPAGLAGDGTTGIAGRVAVAFRVLVIVGVGVTVRVSVCVGVCDVVSVADGVLVLTGVFVVVPVCDGVTVEVVVRVSLGVGDGPAVLVNVIVAVALAVVVATALVAEAVAVRVAAAVAVLMGEVLVAVATGGEVLVAVGVATTGPMSIDPFCGWHEGVPSFRKQPSGTSSVIVNVRFECPLATPENVTLKSAPLIPLGRPDGHAAVITTMPGVLMLGTMVQPFVSAVPLTWVAVTTAGEYVKLMATPRMPVVSAIDTGTTIGVGDGGAEMAGSVTCTAEAALALRKATRAMADCVYRRFALADLRPMPSPSELPAATPQRHPSKTRRRSRVPSPSKSS
jgi:hypothetical protein